VYIRDEEGFHPVEVDDTLKRSDYVSSSQVVSRRAEPSRVMTRKKRSWEKEALIIGGSAGGGALVGGLAAGKKGAAVGAAAGGVGGLIYDLATRKK
jgi:phosphoribosylcarboxyaminoimidazole (NCAIR) mutase